jgi:hypothetical protein
LAGYLGKDDKFVKARFSQNWVFPYWWEFGGFYKKENGIYVPEDELVRLSLITYEERRKANSWFDIFVDVRKYGWEGVLKMQNEKWNDITGSGSIKKRSSGREEDLQNSDNGKQLRLWD